MKLLSKISIVINSVLWQLKVLFKTKNIRLSFLQLLNRNTELKIKNTGNITIKKFCQTERNVSFTVFNGGVICIGEGCFLNKNCSITSCCRVIIGNNVTIGNNVVIVDHDHDFRKINKSGYTFKPVIIEDNVWIGAGSIILQGSHICKDAIVAAGSIVKGNIPSRMIYYNKIKKELIDITKESN